MPTKVILRSDVPKLGAAGDVKSVSAGFARNYLLPRGLALPATEAALALFKKTEAKRKTALDKKLADAKALAGKLEGTALSFSRASAAEGKLFGSVGKTDIAKSLKASGFDVDRVTVQLEAPIKAVGDTEVAIQLHPQVSAKIKVTVLARA